VELLHAYLNTPPELEEALCRLTHRPNRLVGVDSVDSPPRTLQSRPPRTTVVNIVSDYQAGLSTRQLAAKYSRPRTTILALLHSEGVVRPRQRISERQVVKAEQLIRSGISVPTAAKEVGAAYTTLRYALRKR
jgi:hypothetical protein